MQLLHLLGAQRLRGRQVTARGATLAEAQQWLAGQIADGESALDEAAQHLIERGLAVEVDAAAAAKPEPAAKAEARPVEPSQAEEITEQSPIVNKAGAHTRKKVV